MLIFAERSASCCDGGESARRLAVEAVVEYRAAHPQRVADGDGWKVVAVDASGAILFYFPLDNELPTEALLSCQRRFGS